MDFIPMLLLSTVVKKVVDSLRYATSGDVNAVFTQVAAWASGIGLAFIAANSAFLEHYVVNGVQLGDLNSWSLVLVGLAISSPAGVIVDAIKAFDNSNSAVIPNLLGPADVRQGVPGSTGQINAPTSPNLDPRP